MLLENLVGPVGKEQSVFDGIDVTVPGLAKLAGLPDGALRSELQAMDADADRCAAELADARVDVLGYACLVAIMSTGKGYHCLSERRLHQVTAREGCGVPVVTSAGALVEGLRTLKARKVAMIAPYLKPLTKLVAGLLLSGTFLNQDFTSMGDRSCL